VLERGREVDVVGDGERQVEGDVVERIPRLRACGSCRDRALRRCVPARAPFSEEVIERRRRSDSPCGQVEDVVAAAPAEPRDAVAREDAEAAQRGERIRAGSPSGRGNPSAAESTLDSSL